MGNPGPEYHLTRHNAGFLLADQVLKSAERSEKQKLSSLDKIADCWSAWIADKPVAVVKPKTYMNNSGQAVRRLIEQFSISVESQLVVAYDDLDIPLGSVRLRAKGSAGTHKGMESVVAAVGHQNFARLRLGIGPKPSYQNAEDFVLKEFAAAERSAVAGMMDKAAQMIEAVARHGLELAISKYQALIFKQETKTE
ncbi:MAG: aminoacyl-tRNA hydrolase [Elusimicrobia bacterium]|nr:aminoacyl-tRNA hydrolase [Elusimicrobiota bacterium]